MDDRFITQIREGSIHANLNKEEQSILPWALEALRQTNLKLTDFKLELIVKCLTNHPTEDIPTRLVVELGLRHPGGVQRVRKLIERHNGVG
jgi:hypothetical protein